MHKQNNLKKLFSILPPRYGKVISGMKKTVIPYTIRLRRGVRLIHRHWVTSLAVVCSLVTAGLVISIMWRPSVRFSFVSSESCVNKIILLPGLHSVTNDNNYKITLKDTVSFGNFALLSRKTCASARRAPQENASHVVHYSIFGNTFLQQTLKISTPAYPTLDVKPLTNQRVSTKKALHLSVSETDALFDYQFSANNQSVMCNKNDHVISCQVEQFKLVQGKAYDAKLERLFGQQTVTEIFNGVINTAEPVEITESSPANASIAYQPISEIIIKTNQTLKTYEDVTLLRAVDGKEELIPIKVEISDNQIIVKPDQSLQWRSSYKLHIGGLQSTSQGELNELYNLEFKTAGGPVALSSNVSSYAVPTTQTIELKFDQILAPKQDIGRSVSLVGPAGVEAVTIQVIGSRVRVNPDRTLPNCATYTIKITDKIINAYDVGGDSAWSQQFRTKCAIVSVIGYSVQGRPIYAHSFGSGASKVVYVGGMHGNEQGGKYLLDSWVNELESHSERIPAHRTIIVIPNSNPDGVASGRRTNANNVDLNRNFPANDWTAGVYMPGPVFEPQGGGSEPLSEPESKALASYIKNTSPLLVLTYHASAAVVIGNGSGSSGSLAATYAAKSRYSVAADSQADDIFSYTTTGEFEDWLHDKHGVPALLIELASSRGNEFTRNKDAMWFMAMGS